MGDLWIKVVPNASKTEIVGFHEGILKIRLKAQPEKGEANEELILFLSKWLKKPKSAIQLLTGQTHRLKRVKIEGLTHEEIFKLLPGI